MRISRAGAAGATVVFGYWETQSGSPATAPGSGKYQVDSWAAPTLLAVSVIDADGYTRNLAGCQPGDTIIQLAANDSQNYQKWTIVSVTNNTTWVQFAIQVAESGTAFATPGTNQSRLLELVHTEPSSGNGGSPSSPSSRLPSLASPDDIVDRLGRNLNQTEMARVDALLRDGSAIIRRYCRQDFTWVDPDVIDIHADGGIIVLPWKPVASIDGVLALSGVAGIPDIPVTWYHFDDVDKITVMNPSQSGIINLPEFWYEETFWWGGSFRVTGAHGYTVTPDDVTAVLCTAIISELSTPTMSATLASESIGAYSYSMRRTSGAGLRAALEDAGMKTALYDYRKTQGTIKVRL